MSRKESIDGLVAPLSIDQKEIMMDLLESVQTGKLQSQFEKYLPAVIDGKSPTKKAVLAEAKEVTGNRTETTDITAKADSNVVDIKRLAGLN